MREVAAGTTDISVLTALANGYAKAGGGSGGAVMAVSVGPAGEPAEAGSGLAGSLAAKFSPGSRVTVRTVVPVPGLLGKLWGGGIPMVSSVAVVHDPWKGCVGWLKGLLGVDSK